MEISPKKSSFAGITFNNLEAAYLFVFLLILASYFLGAFIVYGYSNYRKTKKEKKELDSQAFVISISVRQWHMEWGRIIPIFRYQSWLFIHYYLPVGLGVISIVVGVVQAV